MSKLKPVFVDRTLECMVCGKEFPRGPNDLARHSSAATLLHLVSSNLSASFPFSCIKCGLCFTTDDHLDMHKKYSSCKISKEAKLIRVKQEPSESGDGLEDKTLECMICGKLFPRGPIDLARHQQGIKSIYFFP